MKLEFMVFKNQLSRCLAILILMGMVFFLGAEYAHSGLKSSDKSMLRIAYANGYKDALEYVFKASDSDKDRLKDDYEYMKKHVTSASNGYVDKVAVLNY